MTSESCEGCVYKRGAECHLMPPIRIHRREYVESGHAMVDGYWDSWEEWGHPPAVSRCSQFKEPQP